MKYRIKETGKVLTWDEPSGHYVTDNGVHFYRSEFVALGLTLEEIKPDKLEAKTLYAYLVEPTGTVEFKTKDMGDWAAVSVSRTPEFDIVYEEKK